MGALAMGGMLLAGVNAALLAVLGAVWVRNYRQFRSGMVLGLVAFSGALLVENLVAVYFSLSMHTLYASDPLVGGTVLVMRSLEFLAVGLLAYVTLQ